VGSNINLSIKEMCDMLDYMFPLIARYSTLFSKSSLKVEGYDAGYALVMLLYEILNINMIEHKTSA
jgi:hypothetical protein